MKVAGDFLIVVAQQQQEAQADKLFRLGLERAQQIKNQTPGSIIESGQTASAVFVRKNASGSQIASDEQSGSWLLTAGTWFHLQGLASGDEAQLLKQAIEIGVEKLAGWLEGFYVIAFYDGRTRELFLVTDIIGSRHCFTRQFGAATVVSTSSLLLASLGECSLDPISAEEFLRTGVVYEDRTFFREVCKLEPATVFRFAEGKLVERQQYWRMSDLDPDRYNGQQAVGELTGRLITAAAKIGKRFARPVCDLTGGYDSRAMVAGFLTAGVRFETTVAGSAKSGDVVIAENLSKLTGKLHWHFEPESCSTFEGLESALRLTDGEYDLVDYARIQSLHEKLSLNFDISINGSFGELARGYWWELSGNVESSGSLDSRMLAARRYMVEPDSPLLFPPESSLNLADHLAEVIDRANDDLTGRPESAQMDSAYLKLRMQRWQGRIASSTDGIWPCLSPFMFRSVMEVMLQTGARWRRNSLLMRMMMAELHYGLASHKLESGHPALPVTWFNWLRFLPAAITYSRKAIDKVASRIGPTKQDANGQSPRLTLWQDEQLRALLQPDNMLISELIDAQRLNKFLSASQQSNFYFDRQWQRLLSLEMALRLCKSVGTGPPD